MDWRQGPAQPIEPSVDRDALRKRLGEMTDAELLEFGKRMHDLVYPLTYGADSKPTVCSFSIKLEAAREEWRKRRFHV